MTDAPSRFRAFQNRFEPARAWRVPGLGASLLLAAFTAVRADDAMRLVPVHAVLPQVAATASDISLSGEIEARITSNIAFRIDGKVTERRVEVGQHITADQVLATLDPTEQKANLDNAKAGLSSAEALLQQAKTSFERQKTLVASGFTTQSSFDSAQESLKTNQALVDVAKAALDTAQEQLSYADLKAGFDGIIVSRSVEKGQVAQTGQTVFTIAQDGPRDAVFNIFEAVLTRTPHSKTVAISLQADPSVQATGEVREISPTVDPTTSTVKVKVGITTTPPQMTLGAAVVGRGQWNERPSLVLPWSTLFQWEGKPAVWVVDSDDMVSVRPVEVLSYATGSLTIASGLDRQQRVVSAGIQLLHPGQKVTVIEGDQL